MPHTQVAPLRSFVESKIGQTTKSTIQQALSAAAGSPALVASLQTAASIGSFAKSQLPTNVKKSIDAALSLVDSEESLNKTIDVIDTQISTVTGQAKSSIDSQLNQAKTRIETSLEHVDRSERVNQVVNLLEPAVLTVVDYVLPDDADEEADDADEEADAGGESLGTSSKTADSDEGFEDATDGSEDGSDQTQQQALQKTLQLTDKVSKRVSKSVRKRWQRLLADNNAARKSLQKRSDEVVKLLSDNGVDLIAYSASLTENVKQLRGTVLDAYVVQIEKIDGVLKSIPPLAEIPAAVGTAIPVTLPGLSGISVDFAALELDFAALDSLKPLESIRSVPATVSHGLEEGRRGVIARLGAAVDEYGPVVAPVLLPVVAPLCPLVVRVTSTLALVCGVALDEAQLRSHPIVLKMLLLAKGDDDELETPPPREDVKIAEANSESKKEMSCKKTAEEVFGI